MIKGRKIILTNGQLLWIRANAATMSRATMAAGLHCHPRTLSKLLRKLNLHGLLAKRWTDRETEALRALAPTHYATAIARKLGRTHWAIVLNARKSGIPLLDWQSKVEGYHATLKRLVDQGFTIKQIAAQTGRSYNTTANRLTKIGLKAKPDSHARNDSPVRPNRAILQSRPAAERKMPIRERVGLPVAVRRPAIVGSLTWCERCHAPVIDTPEGRAEHNQRVHTEPLFAVPSRNRRFA